MLTAIDAEPAPPMSRHSPTPVTVTAPKISSSSGPETLPRELLSNILSNLDLESAKNLRLTSKSIATQCLDPEFLAHFARQRTDLRDASLEGLAALAGHEQLGHAVKHLTVLSTIFDIKGLTDMARTRRRTVVEQNGPITLSTEKKLTDEEAREVEDELAWTRAQIDEHGRQTEDSVIDSLASTLKTFGALDTIDVEGVLLTDKGRKSAPPATIRDWHYLWVRNTHVFRIVMTAIARSGVSVKTLTVFHNELRCSVPSIELAHLLPQLEAEPNFAAAAAAIENFAISISTRVQLDAESIQRDIARLEGADEAWHRAFGSNTGQFGPDDPEASAEENFTGLAGFLRHMRNLEALDVHLYDTLRGSRGAYHRIFSIMAETVELPRLEQVFLRGVQAEKDAVLRFLQKHPKINDLTIRNMCFGSGLWRPVFDYLVGAAALKRLSLSDLMDSTGWLNLALVDKTSQKAPSHQDMISHSGGFRLVRNTFGEEQIRAGLVFENAPGGRPKGSPNLMRWMNNLQNEYGPP